MTLLEAMYCETPPVTFYIKGSGVNWVSLKNVTGLEVDNLDVKAYANAINMLLNDNNLRIKLSRNAKERVIDNFSISKEVEILKEQYNSLLID